MKLNFQPMIIAANRAAIVAKRSLPDALTVAGIAGNAATIFWACKGTLKAKKICDEAKGELAIVDEVHNNPEYSETYSEEDYKTDKLKIKTARNLGVVKCYAGPAVLFVASTAAIGKGYSIQKTRAAEYAADALALAAALKEERKKWKDKYGEEVEKEVHYNLKPEEGEESEKDPEVAKVIDENELAGISEFARFFDESSREWDKNPEYNLDLLLMKQRWANDLLKSQGYLFLNDVYKMLDIPITKKGQRYGWIYSKDNPVGDNFVDFGIFNVKRQKNRDFINGYENVILLDFNVDGPIIDRI